MAEISDFSVTDALNTTRWPEGMAPSQVNNSARADEGLLARWYKDTNGSLTTAGGTTAYTLAINSTTAAAAVGERFKVKINATNTGAVTINITPSGGAARGAVSVTKNGAALVAGDWTANDIVELVYSSTGPTYEMLTPARTPVLTNSGIPLTKLDKTAAATWAGVQTFSNGIIFANETMSTYDEGSFTPGVAFGGGTTGITYSNQVGRYTRIGNVVRFTLYVELSNKGSSTGSATVTGLPFTSANVTNLITPVRIQANLVNLDTAGGYYSPVGVIGVNGTTITLNEQGDNSAVAALTEADFSNTTELRISGDYQV
jgi:hypothetical protein